METIGGDVLAILIARTAKRNTSGGSDITSSSDREPVRQTINPNRGRGVENEERKRASSTLIKDADPDLSPRAGPSIELGSKEALAAKRAYEQSSGTLVSGRLPDTGAGADLGLIRLNEPD